MYKDPLEEQTHPSTGTACRNPRGYDRDKVGCRVGTTPWGLKRVPPSSLPQQEVSSLERRTQNAVRRDSSESAPLCFFLILVLGCQ